MSEFQIRGIARAGRSEYTLGYMRSYRFVSLVILTCLVTAGCGAGRLFGSTLTPIPTIALTSTSTPTFTPTLTPTATEIPVPVGLRNLPQGFVPVHNTDGSWGVGVENGDQTEALKGISVVDGQTVVDLYDTQAVEGIVLNLDTLKVTTTTDALNPNILTVQDENGNTYAENPSHGWFTIPEVQMNYADLKKYTEVEEDYFYDGRNNIVRALNYASSPDQISPDARPIYWITAIGSINTLLCLSYLPIGRLGNAQRDWPNEITITETSPKPFVFSGFYKVNLSTGGYIYVIDRTIKIDDAHTSGLAYGFDQAAYEYMNIYEYPGSPGWTRLRLLIEQINNGSRDLVTIIPPPEHFADGTPISFDPNTVRFEGPFNPVVAGMQGPRGSLILLFSEEDQQRILEVLAANRYLKLESIVTAPLIDPSYLVNLANRILLTTIGYDA